MSAPGRRCAKFACESTCRLPARTSVSRRRWHVRACLCTCALLLPACQTTRPRGATTQPDVPREGNGALFEYVAGQPYVTVEPAYRAIYLLWKGDPLTGDFEALTQALVEARIVRPEWKYPPDAMIDRGSVGYLVCRAARVRSGLNWQLTGLGRYAWRELNYLGIATPISEYGYVPGGQFVGILSRAEDYVRGRGPGEVPRVELGPAR